MADSTYIDLGPVRKVAIIKITTRQTVSHGLG